MKQGKRVLDSDNGTKREKRDLDRMDEQGSNARICWAVLVICASGFVLWWIHVLDSVLRPHSIRNVTELSTLRPLAKLVNEEPRHPSHGSLTCHIDNSRNNLFIHAQNINYERESKALNRLIRKDKSVSNFYMVCEERLSTLRHDTYIAECSERLISFMKEKGVWETSIDRSVVAMAFYKSAIDFSIDEIYVSDKRENVITVRVTPPEPFSKSRHTIAASIMAKHIKHQDLDALYNSVSELSEKIYSMDSGAESCMRKPLNDPIIRHIHGMLSERIHDTPQHVILCDEISFQAIVRLIRDRQMTLAWRGLIIHWITLYSRDDTISEHSNRRECACLYEVRKRFSSLLCKHYSFAHKRHERNSKRILEDAFHKIRSLYIKLAPILNSKNAQAVIHRLETLQMSMVTCDQTLHLKENSINASDYESFIFSMEWSGHSKVSEYTFPFQSSDVCGPHDSFVTPNARYDSVNHRIEIPSGIVSLDYDTIESGSNSTMRIYFVLGHEIAHSTEDLWTDQTQMQCVINDYNDGVHTMYGSNTMFENRADIIGLSLSICSMIDCFSSEVPEKQLVRYMIDSYTSLWCPLGSEKNHQSEHSSGLDRATRPFSHLPPLLKKIIDLLGEGSLMKRPSCLFD